MGKIVIKTIKNGNAAKIEIRNFEEIDAAKILLAAFISVTRTLDYVTKTATFRAALELCRDEAYGPKIEVTKWPQNSV